jgi:prevent-host-death family protein
MDRNPETCTDEDFRENISTHLQRARKGQRATVVTRDGKAAAVLLSAREFERLSTIDRLEANRAKVRKSMAEIDSGNWLTIEDAFERASQPTAPARSTRKKAAKRGSRR